MATFNDLSSTVLPGHLTGTVHLNPAVEDERSRQIVIDYLEQYLFKKGGGLKLISAVEDMKYAVGVDKLGYYSNPDKVRELIHDSYKQNMFECVKKGKIRLVQSMVTEQRLINLLKNYMYMNKLGTCSNYGRIHINELLKFSSKLMQSFKKKNCGVFAQSEGILNCISSHPEIFLIEDGIIKLVHDAEVNMVEKSAVPAESTKSNIGHFSQILRNVVNPLMAENLTEESRVIDILKTEIQKKVYHMNKISGILSGLPKKYKKLAEVYKLIYQNPKIFVVENGYVRLAREGEENVDLALNQLRIKNNINGFNVKDVVTNYLKDRITEYGKIPCEHLGCHVKVLDAHLKNPSVSCYTKNKKVLSLCKSCTDIRIFGKHVFINTSAICQSVGQTTKFIEPCHLQQTRQQISVTQIVEKSVSNNLGGYDKNVLEAERSLNQTILNAPKPFSDISQFSKTTGNSYEDTVIIDIIKTEIKKNSRHMNQISAVCNVIAKKFRGKKTNFTKPYELYKLIYRNPKDFIVKDGFIRVASGEEKNVDWALKNLHLENVYGNGWSPEEIVLKFLKARVIEYGQIPLILMADHIHVLYEHFKNPSVLAYTKSKNAEKLCRGYKDFIITPNNYVTVKPNVQTLGVEMPCISFPKEMLHLHQVGVETKHTGPEINRDHPYGTMSEYELDTWFRKNLQLLLNHC